MIEYETVEEALHALFEINEDKVLPFNNVHELPEKEHPNSCSNATSLPIS